MADIRAGGKVVNPKTGKTVTWTPIEPVADEYDAVQRLASKGYSCLGVIGNAAHLSGSGGHTPWCSEGYAGKACKLGKVYAIDLHVADPDTKFLAWLRAKLQAGAYSWLFYLNYQGHQITRVDGWKGTYTSGDQHLHLSGLAGHEADNSSILADWETHRTAPVVPNISSSQEVDMAAVPQEQWDRARAQLDAISDTVTGGKGSAYRESIMRKDHGYQLDVVRELVNNATSELETRLTAIEAKLDAIAAPATPATGA